MEILQISEIQIIPIKPKNGLVAFTSCVINDFLCIGNIAVYTSLSRSEGFRLVYPSKTLPNGKEINYVYPINKEAGEITSKAIIRKFREISSKIVR